VLLTLDDKVLAVASDDALFAAGLLDQVAKAVLKASAPPHGA
jgi:hypothetical protein